MKYLISIAAISLMLCQTSCQKCVTCDSILKIQVCPGDKGYKKAAKEGKYTDEKGNNMSCF